jgi:hypothetical protein
MFRPTWAILIPEYGGVQRYKTLKTSNLKLKTPYDEPDAMVFT